MQKNKLSTIGSLITAGADEGNANLKQFEALEMAKQSLKDYNDLLKEKELLYQSGSLSAGQYFEFLMSKEVAAFEELNIRKNILQEIATLENTVGNKSLMDFIKVNEAKKKTLQDLKNAAVMTNQQMLQATSSSLSRLGSALSAAGEKNKAFARAGQVVAIGQATIDTYLAVQKARSSAPPPLNYVLAGIELAAGLLNVANIASQKFAQGTDTVPSMLSPGEMVVPRTFAQAIRQGDLTLGGRGNSDSFGDININIYGADMSSGMGIERTAEMLGFEIERKLRGARSIA
jgi:hypothetical protein